MLTRPRSRILVMASRVGCVSTAVALGSGQACVLPGKVMVMAMGVMSRSFALSLVAWIEQGRLLLLG
jgi:hypothetical protein